MIADRAADPVCDCRRPARPGRARPDGARAADHRRAPSCCPPWRRRWPRSSSGCPARAIAAEALAAHGAFVLVADLEAAVDVANRLAPEHLELMVADPRRAAAAGAARRRHLPRALTRPRWSATTWRAPTTCCRPAAPRASPRALGTEDFVKRSSVIEYSPSGLAAAWPHLAALAARRGAGRPRSRPPGAHRAQGRHQRMSGTTDPAAGARRAQDEGDGDRAAARTWTAPARPRCRPPIPFFNHMLEAWSKHGLMDLAVDGQGRPRGRHPPHGGGRRASAWARRCARPSATSGASSATAPRSCRWTRRCCRPRSTSRAGRSSSSTCRWRGRGSPNFDLDLLQDFFRAFAFNAEITLHVNMHYGENLHHIAEAIVQGGGPRARRGHAAQSRASPACCPRPRARCSRGAGLVIAVVDYGRGNLGTVEKAFAPRSACRRSSPRTRASSTSAEAVVLPGDGAFHDAMANLGRARPARAGPRAPSTARRPFLGICLGYQLLFTESEEFGHGRGPRRASRASCAGSRPGLKVPHMGWNRVEHGGDLRAVRGDPSGAHFYFVHSYFPVVASAASTR